MTEKERIFAGELYNPIYAYSGPAEESPWFRVHKAQKDFNASEFWHETNALKRLRKCFAQSSDDLVLTPPFYCDYGDRIHFGKQFYANTGLTILDANEVFFGDRVFLGPHVSIYTSGHPIDAFVRGQGVEYAKPVRIGNDVWIGGNVVINPGVVIGDDVVIGSGSVVVSDIPDHVVAAGNPCRVIRPITEEDQRKWGLDYDAYRMDEDVIRGHKQEAPQETVYVDEMTAEERVQYDRMIAGAEQMTLFDLL